MSAAVEGPAAPPSARLDDWSTRVETWAMTAQSPPTATILEEDVRMTVDDTTPEPDPATARSSARGRTLPAGERLLEVSATIGTAYADACQQAINGLTRLHEQLSDANADDWRSLVRPYGGARGRAAGRSLNAAAEAATRVNEQLLTAGKKLGLAYLDACEQSVLCAVELREQAVAASEHDLVRSFGTTRARLMRDVTRTYADVTRRLLLA